MDDKKNVGDKEQKTASTIKKWLERISFSQKYRKRIAEKYHWKTLNENYRGDFSSVQMSSDIYIPSLNLIFAYIKSEIPSLYLRDPKIKVNPKNGSSILSGKILEKALNYLWRTKRIKRENKKNILDSLLVGHSWFKSGYTGKFGTIEDGNGNTFEFIEEEDFFGYRVPYENITFNPDSNDPPFDCSWIAHEVWIPLEDLKNNKEFRNVEELPVATITDNGINKVENSDDKHRIDPKIERVKLFEIWDKKTQTIFTISENCDKYIREPQEWPYEMNGFPFSFLRLNDDPFCPYGIPDTFMFAPQVEELMKIRATELDHLKRYNRQLLLSKGHMEDDAKAQFARGETGAVIEVRTDGKPLGDIVAPIPYPPLPSDIYALEDRINNDVINISGQNPQERGATVKTTTRTIGELESIQKGSANRRSDKIDTIEDFIEDIAGNLVALLQQLATEPYFVRIAGDDMVEILDEVKTRPSAVKPGAKTTSNGFTFTKDDIQGEFDFEVIAGSTTPMDSNKKLQIIIQLFELLPKTGVMPGGPIYKFLGQEMGDELDFAGLRKAIKEEEDMAQANQAKAEANAEEMKQLNIATTTAETRLKAEREATRQNETMIKGLELFKKEPPKGE